VSPAARAAGERGFAIPAVIFLVALLTLLLTTGLARVRADRQIAEASEASAEAFALAQSGLQAYIGTLAARPPDGDSVRINLVGGYANVIAHLVQHPADTTERSLYLVRSTGVVINPLSGPTPQGRRTVAQFADWQTGWIERRGALTAVNGVDVAPNFPFFSRSVSGVDGCLVEPAIPGIRVDTAVGSVGALTLAGDPPLIRHGNAAGPMIATQTEIDWFTARSPSFVPDFNSFQSSTNTFPIQRVNNDLNVFGGANSSGILIVPGDLTIAGFFNFRFRGIILVGGRIIFLATSITIDGLVYSGLNEHPDIGAPPAPRTDIGLGGLNIRFDSCRVDSALAALTGMAPVPNAWVDRWAEY
jgi:hypothetical protein